MEKNIKMHKKLLFSAYYTNITWDIGLFPLICWCTYTDILAAFLKMEVDTQYVKNMYRFRSLFSSQLIHVKNMENISNSLGFLTVILHTSVGTVLSSSQQGYQFCLPASRKTRYLNCRDSFVFQPAGSPDI